MAGLTLSSLNPFDSQNIWSNLDPADISGHAKRKEKKKLREIEEKRSRLKLSKQGAETIRQAQLESAKLRQISANRGVQDTTAVAGGLGSIQSQAGANLGFANQIFSLNQQAQSRLNKLAHMQALTKNAMTVGTFFLGGIGGAAVAASGSFGDGGSFGNSVWGGHGENTAHTPIANQPGVF